MNAMEDARGRRAELQTEMDGMTSRLDVLAEDVRLREEELASLRGDVEFARAEKEEGHGEYEEIGICLVRRGEELSRASREVGRLERETAEATQALEEARAEREKMLGEARTSAARSKAKAKMERAEEATVRARKERDRARRDRASLDEERTEASAALSATRDKLAQEALEGAWWRETAFRNIQNLKRNCG